MAAEEFSVFFVFVGGKNGGILSEAAKGGFVSVAVRHECI